MSVVSYCPFRGKNATGLNGTEKSISDSEFIKDAIMLLLHMSLHCKLVPVPYRE